MIAETIVLTVLAGLTAYNGYYDRKAKREMAVQTGIVADKAAVVADKAKEVKDLLETNTGAVKDQLQNLQNTADDTHKLVNNNMAIQLKINAIGARELANTTKRPEHLRLAEEAEHSLSEHLAKQAAVDSDVASRGETKSTGSEESKKN